MTNFGSMQNRKQSKYQQHQLFRSDKGQRWVHCPNICSGSQNALRSIGFIS